MQPQPFDGAALRANPAYELVLRDRLGAAEQAFLGDGPDLYGLLRPRLGAALVPRAVSRDTALLLYALAQPGPLPAFVRADLGPQVGEVVARLVLDGVLEVACDGGFATGPTARDLVLPVVLPALERRPHGVLGELSLAALHYGQSLAGLSAERLAARLYDYGRRPLSPRWRSRLPDEAALRIFLGEGAGGPLGRALARAWRETTADPVAGALHPVWRMWRPRREPAARPAAEPVAYKLYVSPAAEALPAAVLAIAEELAGAAGVRGFKIGRTLPEICRPDKLVVYLARREDLHAAAELLAGRLAGVPAHGVAFTAEAGAGGLLSWAIDPPASPFHRTPAAERWSWRLWVVQRLAEALLAARGAGLPEPWRHALDRLRLDGVDPATWIPESRFWNRWGEG